MEDIIVRQELKDFPSHSNFVRSQSVTEGLFMVEDEHEPQLICNGYKNTLISSAFFLKVRFRCQTINLTLQAGKLELRPSEKKGESIDLSHPIRMLGATPATQHVCQVASSEVSRLT